MAFNGNFNGICLVVAANPPEKYDESSVGMMTFPIDGQPTR